ncbi:cysteine proteinase [Ceratobasidium sp. AG-I]|nr:cysteine proteinase [Ceratobasidium sp. AG-I]
MSAYLTNRDLPKSPALESKRELDSAAGFEQKAGHAGLLLTDELQTATERCRKKVQAIAKDCRERNFRFRDIEFDLEEDKERCLHGLETSEENRHSPSDVLRVTKIFEQPQFFIDGARSSDICQGTIGDCWFMSAMTAVCSMEGLIDRICVARDEQVGVYGFIFYRNSGWVDVIIDDLLYTNVPKYEELSVTEKRIYHNDKEQFNLRARKGGKSLYFAKSTTENETWVPLLEKAYAKIHGDYASLKGGSESEAIEDMTGALSTTFHVHDILDTDKFWDEQLLNANKNVLFGCLLDSMVGPNADSKVKGLYTLHSYSVLNALEVAGKRFLRLRNPWGESEWTGRWSDGSKEWTPEWLARLPELKHKFGDDGEFLMEYEDFLKTWTMIERSRLFDADWKMSSTWLNVNSRSFPCAWNFGDVSFTFSVTEDTPAVIVLSRLDERYFRELSGFYYWTMDFKVYRKDAPVEEPYARSTHTVFWKRSVNVELKNLEAGEYVVHVRLDRDERREKSYYKDSVKKWNHRKLSKVLAEAAVSKSIAANFDPTELDVFLPNPLENYAGQDLNALEISHYEESQTRLPVREVAPASISVPSTETKECHEKGDDAQSESSSVVLVEKGDCVEWQKIGHDKNKESKNDENDSSSQDKRDPPPPNNSVADPRTTSEIPIRTKESDEIHEGFNCDECNVAPIVGPRYHCLDATCIDYDLCSKCMAANKHDQNHRMLCIRNPVDASKLKDTVGEDEDNTITLGLRLYTKGDSVAKISGQLRHGNFIGWTKKDKRSATASISLS